MLEVRSQVPEFAGTNLLAKEELQVHTFMRLVRHGFKWTCGQVVRA
jgi:hypothetical protein